MSVFSLRVVFFMVLTSAYSLAAVAEPDWAHNFDVTVQAGLTEINTEQNASYQTNFGYPETQQMHQTNQLQNFIYSAGVGYIYALPTPQNNLHWLPATETALNFSQFLQTTAKGQINQDATDPPTYNYNYNLPLNSMRLMLDEKLFILSWHHILPFVMAGLGPSYDEVGYHDSVSSAQDNGAITLNNHYFWQFAWEVGAGAQYQLTQQWSVGLTYLYTDLGQWSSSSSGTIDRDTDNQAFNLAAPAKFNVNSSTELLAVTYRF